MSQIEQFFRLNLRHNCIKSFYMVDCQQNNALEELQLCDAHGDLDGDAVMNRGRKIFESRSQVEQLVSARVGFTISYFVLL